MAEFIARWFTPSNSDGGRGTIAANAQRPEKVAAEQSGVARRKTPTKFGGKIIKDEVETAKKMLLGL